MKTLVLLRPQNGSWPAGHRSLIPAQPNSFAKKTRAFSKAHELRERAALYASPLETDERPPEHSFLYQV